MLGKGQLREVLHQRLPMLHQPELIPPTAACTAWTDLPATAWMGAVINPPPGITSTAFVAQPFLEKGFPIKAPFVAQWSKASLLREIIFKFLNFASQTKLGLLRVMLFSFLQFLNFRKWIALKK